MIANIDENIGKLDAFLRDSGLRDNTIVIFLTDNGGTAGRPVFNAGMRGGKIDLYDGGHRVPCFRPLASGKAARAGRYCRADPRAGRAADADRSVRLAKT